MNIIRLKLPQDHSLEIMLVGGKRFNRSFGNLAIVGVGRINSESELKQLYEESTALLTLSQFETFGLVAQEAMAFVAGSNNKWYCN